MKNLILILTLFIMNSYYAQSLKDFDLNTRTFDIETYNKNKNDSGNYWFDLDNHIEVYQYPNSRGKIKEEITREGDPYSIAKVYYSNGKLSYAKRLFYGFNIGTSIDYDENGRRQEGTNWDYLYTFSVEDLVKKMKEEYGIDLSVVTDGYSVSKVHTSPADNEKPLYSVFNSKIGNDSLRRDGGLVQYRLYDIDGSTGAIIKITERVYMGEDGICKEGCVFDEDWDFSGATIKKYRFYETDGKGEVMKITEKRQVGTIYDRIEILEEKIIYEKPGNKEGAYHIHKGKKYTEPQWDKLKEDELKKYARKNNISLGKDKGTGFFLDEREI